ncbi:GNAT family N-acetyltransferase [Bacteroides sp.]|uniref:GNAT family N-acetyltransferase n=1 Tax=Bacteroides sp. TaxID=29523 RepID=UPI00261E8D72|nr:GNAT family N-acetyltransferase [Bacteroides sp.]MDD3036672.1 GNAT family N-acetyltransferase [Bacteroides sp.]
MDYKIIHQQEQKMFKTEVDGRTAFVQYRLLGNSLDIIHTIVPQPIEGRGIAAALVKAAYDYALRNGLKPKATCSYAVKWLERHPEVNDIVG